ncbi:MAG: YceI family protein [Bacteroidales bacterium]|nr:YceI family protein [Bacteroidales bacterium]
MKNWILPLILLVFSTQIIQAQNLLYTKTGHAYFMSHTEAIDIDGNNNQVTSFLNIETGEIAFQMLVKSFKFTLATAEEHFNETYMESDKYPKAQFKGFVENMQSIDLKKDGTYKAQVKGDLTIHGVSKNIKQEGNIVVKNGKITANSAFTVNIDDYAIKVPKMVEDRVAKIVDIKVDVEYVPYSK